MNIQLITLSLLPLSFLPFHILQLVGLAWVDFLILIPTFSLAGVSCSYILWRNLWDTAWVYSAMNHYYLISNRFWKNLFLWLMPLTLITYDDTLAVVLHTSGISCEPFTYSALICMWYNSPTFISKSNWDINMLIVTFMHTNLILKYKRNLFPIVLVPILFWGISWCTSFSFNIMDPLQLWKEFHNRLCEDRLISVSLVFPCLPAVIYICGYLYSPFLSPFLKW